MSSVTTVSNYELEKRVRSVALSVRSEGTSAEAIVAQSNGAASAAAVEATWRSFEAHKLTTNGTTAAAAPKHAMHLSVSFTRKLVSATSAVARAGSIYVELVVSFRSPPTLNSAVQLPAFPCFYWHGPLVELVVAHPAISVSLSESGPSATLASAEALLISVSRLEDLLVCRKTEFVIAALAGDSEPVRRSRPRPHAASPCLLFRSDSFGSPKRCAQSS